MYVLKFVIGSGGRLKRNYFPESSNLLSCVIAVVLDDFPSMFGLYLRKGRFFESRVCFQKNIIYTDINF